MQEIVRGGRRKEPVCPFGEKPAFRGNARPPDGGTDYRSYRLSFHEWLRYILEGAALCALAAYTCYRSTAAFFLMLPFGLCYPLYKRRSLKKARLRTLAIQFKEGILVLSSFLNAGYSLENSFSLSVRELEQLYGENAMITAEFRRLLAGIGMNRQAEELIAEFGERSGIEDAEYFAGVFAAARRSGGSLIEIISHTAEIIRDKVQVQEEIHTMTAARVFEQKIMNAIPFLIVFYIDISSPGFFSIMYETWIGRGIMTGCLLVYAAAVFLAGRILDIAV